MASKKSKTNNFSTMVAEFGKNWKTIPDAAAKRDAALKEASKGL